MNLSVIIPVYNRQQAAENAARSVLLQKLDDFELIIVDDCSNPPFQCPADMLEDNRIRVIRHKQNKGAGAARNTGIRNAAGKYIALLDSDDLWRAGKLSAQLKSTELLEAQNPNVPTAIVCGFRLKSAVTGKDSKLQPVPSHKLSDFVSGCWFCPGSTLLIERQVYDIVGAYDEDLRRLEDTDWFIRFAIAGGALHSVKGTYVDIEAGQRPTSDLIMESSSYLLQKYGDVNDNKLQLDSANLRYLKSYLALEQAASHAAQNKRLATIGALIRSFVLKPRLRLQLGKWWD